MAPELGGGLFERARPVDQRPPGASAPLAVGGVKDLRQMTRETHAQFNDIVLKGLRVQKGMASFAKLLSVEEVEAVHAYVISRAQEDWGGGATGNTGGPH